MNRLDRMIKKERKAKYKYYRKIFKARDMASKHVKGTVTVKLVHSYFGQRQIDVMFKSTLAKEIVDRGGVLTDPIRPPVPHGTLSITKPSMTVKPPMPPVTKKVISNKKPPTPPVGPEPVLGRRT